MDQSGEEIHGEIETVQEVLFDHSCASSIPSAKIVGNAAVAGEEEILRKPLRFCSRSVKV